MRQTGRVLFALAGASSAPRPRLFDRRPQRCQHQLCLGGGIALERRCERSQPLQALARGTLALRIAGCVELLKIAPDPRVQPLDVGRFQAGLDPPFSFGAAQVRWRSRQAFNLA